MCEYPMPDDAIMAALAKRADAEERIKKYERGIRRAKDEIIEISKFIRAWEKFSGRAIDSLEGIKPLNDKGEFVATVDGQQVRMAPVNSRKEEVVGIAKLVLSEVGKPMSRNDLFKGLVARGIAIHGANPEMVLSTMLWRMRDTSGIVRLKSGGYDLAENADPDDADDSEDEADDKGE
jgi:hypothetical protein